MSDPRTESTQFTLTLRKTIATDLTRAAVEREVALATYIETTLREHVLQLRAGWERADQERRAAEETPLAVVVADQEQDAERAEPEDVTPAVYQYKTHYLHSTNRAGGRLSLCGYWLKAEQPATEDAGEVTCGRCLNDLR